MRAVGDPAPSYVVIGVIADNGSNAGMVGRDTYLASTSGWFAWDGEHMDHAAHFASRELAMAAALSCPGPLFRLPRPDSIHAVESGPQAASDASMARDSAEG